MELTDILPIEKWIALEEDIQQRSGLMASVYNLKGIRITGRRQWVNRLCPAIKATDKGQAFICAVAHMNLAIVAEKTRQAVIEECDAGLIKMVVPIFVGDERVGAFGGCGLLLEDGEVDSFMVNRTTEIPEEEIEALSADIATISRHRAEDLAAHIQQRLTDITAPLSSSRPSS